MEVVVTVLLFIVGFVLIIKGGDFMVDSSLRLSKITGISHIIIGVTVVSLCTTLPELLVNLIGASTGKTDLAVGNAVGSMLCNSTLILGIVMTFLTKSVKRSSFWFKSMLYVFACTLLFIFCFNFTLTLWESLVLFSLFLIFFIVNIISGVREAKIDMKIKKEQTLTKLEKEIVEGSEFLEEPEIQKPEKYKPTKDIIFLSIILLLGISTLILTPIDYTEKMISTANIGILAGVFLLFIVQFVVQMLYKFKYGVIPEEDTNELIGEKLKRYRRSKRYKTDILKSIFYYILGGFLVYLGATLLVDNGQNLAVDYLGIDPIIVGITIVAIGTSLPELVTALISIKKKTMGLALGNMIGASLINATMIIGLSGTVAAALNTPITLSKDTLYITLPVVLFASLIICLPTIIKQKTYKWQGYILLGTYILYNIYLFATLGNLFG